MDLDEALELAELHHSGQVDKAGRPYIGHISRVVDAVDTPEEKLAAALHDLLEDTDMTAADLLTRAARPRSSGWWRHLPAGMTRATRTSCAGPHRTL
jgi:hypothetical protein